MADAMMIDNIDNIDSNTMNGGAITSIASPKSAIEELLEKSRKRKAGDNSNNTSNTTTNSNSNSNDNNNNNNNDSSSIGNNINSSSSSISNIINNSSSSSSSNNNSSSSIINNNVNSSSSSSSSSRSKRSKEELIDKLLPLANIRNIIDRIKAKYADISDDAVVHIQNLTAEYIGVIISASRDQCVFSNKKVLEPDDVLTSMAQLGFLDHAECLSRYLTKLKQPTVLPSVPPPPSKETKVKEVKEVKDKSKKSTKKYIPKKLRLQQQQQGHH